MTSNHPADANPTRAISTVLDAAVFLLLVSAAIGLLYAAPQTDEDGAADPDVAAETATTLATSIETIEYAPAPDGDRADAATTRPDRGTIAELLAETTVANARLDGEPLTRAPNHEAAVRNATRRTIHRIDSDVRIQVRTQWRPLPGSGLRGGVVVGPSPPEDADVHAATMTVPVGTAASAGPARSGWKGIDTPDLGDGEVGGGDAYDSPPGRSASLASVASRAGCDGLGRILADSVVGSAFPPGPTKQAFRSGGEATELVEARYDTAATALEVDPNVFHAEMQPRRRNELLADELAERFTATCEGYDSPTVAAERAAPDTVVVSVRTWSP